MNVDKIVDEITEGEAMRMLMLFSSRFGWTDAVFAREDVSNEWHDNELSLTDDEWEFVRTSRAWVNMSDRMVQDGFEYLREAVWQCKKDYAEKVSAETTDDGARYMVSVDGAYITGFVGNVHEASKVATYWADRGYNNVTLVLQNWEDVYGRVPMISAERFHVEVRTL